jgi:hypothetical protein
MRGNPAFQSQRVPEASFVKKRGQQNDSKNKVSQCAECTVSRKMIDNLTNEFTSLRERAAGAEETTDITVRRLTTCLADQKQTVEWLSSELRKMKVSHSIRNHEDKYSIFAILFSCTLHYGP